MTALVLDNTPISHFARAGQLAVLETLTAGFRRIVPAEVLRELADGVSLHPALAQSLTQPWLEPVELVEIDEVVAFAGYKAELGGGIDRNNGEAAVLAWAKVHGGTTLIDERAATRIAKRDDIDVHGTMWLIVNGFKAGHLSRVAASRMVDQLAATDMALPTDGEGCSPGPTKRGFFPDLHLRPYPPLST